MEWDGVAIDLRFAEVNGIRVRYARAGPVNGPLVFFCHGWPELWFSWRHQLAACGKAGFHAVAPDMRGYGGTSAPGSRGREGFEKYNIASLAGDAIGLVHHLGYGKAILVGHDWGGWAVWMFAALYPNVFTAVCSMSVPYVPMRSVSKMKKIYGDPEKPEDKPKFFYMLHHNLKEAALQYEADIRETFFRLLATRTGNEPPPEVTSDELYVDGKSVSMLQRMSRPLALPAWLSEEELQYYVREFTRTGFAGGLHWYQTMDLHELLAPEAARAESIIEQPSLFIAGEKDMVIPMMGGKDAIIKNLTDKVPKLRKCVFYPDAGHWVQQEKAAAVNEELITWLQQLNLDEVCPKGFSRL